MATPDWLTPQQQYTWRALIEGFSLLRRELERDLVEQGLTLGDYEILVRLSETTDEHVLLSHLAESLVFSRSRLSHQIARLESDGLVRREPCERDRRAWHVVLTPRGLQRLRDVAPTHATSVRRHLFDHLSASQVRAIGAAFDSVAQAIRTPE